jgi:hypothetical protein
MKTYLTVFCAGVVLASMAFGAQGDPFQEERFKAKTGRYTQAEEARRLTAAAKSDVRTEKCMDQECCRHQDGASQKQTDAQAFFDAWSRAKYGRNIREAQDRSEVRLASMPAGSSSGAMCGHPKCCD